jgi:hypothetical protein
MTNDLRTLPSGPAVAVDGDLAATVNCTVFVGAVPGLVALNPVAFTRAHEHILIVWVMGIVFVLAIY